jgi:hypothetical protein
MKNKTLARINSDGVLCEDKEVVKWFFQGFFIDLDFSGTKTHIANQTYYKVCSKQSYGWTEIEKALFRMGPSKALELMLSVLVSSYGIGP